MSLEVWTARNKATENIDQVNGRKLRNRITHGTVSKRQQSMLNIPRRINWMRDRNRLINLVIMSFQIPAYWILWGVIEARRSTICYYFKRLKKIKKIVDEFDSKWKLEEWKKWTYISMQRVWKQWRSVVKDAHWRETWRMLT